MWACDHTHLWTLGCAQISEARPLDALGNLHHIQACWPCFRQHLHSGCLSVKPLREHGKVFHAFQHALDIMYFPCHSTYLHYLS